MSNMDVTKTTGAVQAYGLYSTQTAGTNSKAANQSTQTQSTEPNFGDASDVSISTEGRNALQSDLSVDKDDAQVTKGLSDEQVRALNDELAMHEQTMLNLMIQALTDSNEKLQGWVDDGVEKLNFGGTLIDVSSFGLPEVATNPEDAAKAIGEGGDWSVDAVATRIFDLANAIAGGDPEKLSAMRAAVEDGFKQAGLTWKDATGADEMPEITKNTYNEIMSRFDARAQELNPTEVVE